MRGVPGTHTDCTVDGCGLRARGRGYCDQHYQQWRKHGRIIARGPCRVCGGPITGKVRSDAKVCAGDCQVEWDRAYQSARHAATDKWSRIQKQYGVTKEWWDAQLEKSGGACPTCRSLLVEKWVVDHDHVSGRPRGLLCSPCNVALGMAADSPDVLRRLADYLEGRL